MRTVNFGLILLLLLASGFAQRKAAPGTPAPAKREDATAPRTCSLTVHVDGVDQKPGNVGMLVFSANELRGWPEDRTTALKDISVPAHQGTVTITVPDLPAGDYGVALIHDVNMNHKIDKNFLGMPKEQWGMSNNPHATVKAPPFAKARFTLDRDKEIRIQLQQ